MPTTTDRFAAAVAVLADHGLADQDPRQDAEVMAQAWGRPRGRDHRFLKLPEDVWARIRAATNSDAYASLGEDPYARFLPPRAFLQIDRSALADPAVRDAAAEVARTWIALQTECARHQGDLALIVDRFQDDAWQAVVDEADDAATTEAPAPDAAEAPAPASRTLATLDPVVAHLPLDAAARRALSAYLEALDKAGVDRSGLDAGALLVGLWGASLRIPRLDEDWDAAGIRLTSGAPWSKLGLPDVAAARVSLMADNAIGSADPDAWERLVTWAYGRSQRWPMQRTVDPALHKHLVEMWRSEGEQKLSTELTAPGLAVAPVWSTFVKTAASTTAMPATAVEPRPDVVRAAPSIDRLLAELDALQGLVEVKARVAELVQFARLERDRAALGLPNDPMSRHLVLVGNPGTGKTTVARLIGRILHVAGALPSSKFLEVRRPDFVGSYRGETETKTRRLLDNARGGILFIDEAYALVTSDRDTDGAHILAELVAAMENHRDDLVVVAAGYPGPMARFLEGNPGLESRFSGTILFPDLDNAALTAAFMAILDTGGYRNEYGVQQAVYELFTRVTRGANFGNAREARNLYDVARRHLAARHAQAPGEVDPALITREDIPRPPGPVAVDDDAVADSTAAIDRLIGLATVKVNLADLVATAKVAHERWKADPSVPPVLPGHFAFVGRPGTGKTTVAQHLGQVYRAMGLLRSGHVITANRATLVAQYIGQTAPRVREAVRAALDGVLFIDEAYALLPQDAYRDFGHEALATLVEEMEANRERLVVVLAGYPREMERLLAGNAGLASRVRTTITFEDFSQTELAEIAELMATQQGILLEPAAAQRIAASANAMRRQPAFANGRTVRNLLDEAVTSHARRLAPHIGSGLDAAELRTVRAGDVPDVEYSPQWWGQYL